jgi:hypothetical protein
VVPASAVTAAVTLSIVPGPERAGIEQGIQKLVHHGSPIPGYLLLEK